jgi:intracellular septation protein
MQALLEFVPLVAFVAAYYLRGIYFATGVLMVAMCLLVAVTWLRTRKVSSLLGISTALVLAFGAVTLWLRDERFIQWKPTVFFWGLALAFLASQWIGARPLIQRLMEAALPDLRVARSAWLRLNLAWVVFYLAMGAANLAVARLLDEQTWVNFKVFGITALTFAFVLGQAFWLQRQGLAADPVGGEGRDP